ncbi:13139_t:CDS:2 [Ambispora leptoticha]|uniref:13139_t:CDS:1 n=1 Tax=Ambispora leptoticha TaxID=144679 RepID=A0A9N8ZB13_9GLOM|nr:13139_t:CDS:2 [Ambispora leptoticha]
MSEAWLRFAKYYPPNHKQIGNDPEYRNFKVQLALYKKNRASLIIQQTYRLWRRQINSAKIIQHAVIEWIYRPGIPASRGKIKDTSMLVQTHLKLEYLDFAHDMAFRNDFLIVAIIRSSPNLKHFNISHNDVGDEVVEALAHTCHEIEYLDLEGLAQAMSVTRPYGPDQGLHRSWQGL